MVDILEKVRGFADVQNYQIKMTPTSEPQMICFQALHL